MYVYIKIGIRLLKKFHVVLKTKHCISVLETIYVCHSIFITTLSCIDCYTFTQFISSYYKTYHIITKNNWVKVEAQWLTMFCLYKVGNFHNATWGSMQSGDMLLEEFF